MNRIAQLEQLIVNFAGDHLPQPHHPASYLAIINEAKAIHEKREITISKEEASLIRDLIKLYDETTEYSHGTDCECSLCEAHTIAGSHDFRLFDSLEEKTR